LAGGKATGAPNGRKKKTKGETKTRGAAHFQLRHRESRGRGWGRKEGRKGGSRIHKNGKARRIMVLDSKKKKRGGFRKGGKGGRAEVAHDEKK